MMVSSAISAGIEKVRLSVYPNTSISSDSEERNIKKLLYSLLPLQKFFSRKAEILPTEPSVTVSRLPEFPTETVITKEVHETPKHKQLMIKFSNLIDVLISQEENFKELNKDRVLANISKLINRVSIDWDKVSDNDLAERLKGVLAIELMSGLLKDLTPEQIKIFDEAVKRRPLFKSTTLG